MTALRILSLDDGTCILFNSFEKRVSGICPGHVAAIAKKVVEGDSLDEALIGEQIAPAEKERTRSIISYITGEYIPDTRPFDIDQNAFYKTLVLCPSSMCNLKCIYCSGSAKGTTGTKMDWELAKTAIDFFFAHVIVPGPYTLQFHGAGEPTTNFEGLKRSVEYARQIAGTRGAEVLVRLTTNGLIPEKSAQWLAENVNHVTLSIDGPPDIHNIQRPTLNGGESYSAVVRTLQLLDRSGVVKRLNTVITPSSLPRMEEILNHIRSLCSVEEIRILPMSYCGHCEINDVAPLNMESFKNSYESVMPLAAQLGFKVKSYIEQFEYYTDYYCGACGFNMVVSPDGNISTCVEVLNTNDVGATEMIIGHYDKEQKQIHIEWDKVHNLRKRSHKTLTPCMDCTFKTNCAGSCLVKAARKNGTVMSVDPESCKITYNTLKKLVIEHANPGVKTFSYGFDDHPTKKDSFTSMCQASRAVIKKFDTVQQRPWGIESSMIELMKQVGDLSKHVMTIENYYTSDRKQHPQYASTRDSIGNELADILHAIIRIADHYHIDLEEMHYKARENEVGYIDWIRANAHKQKADKL